VLGEMTDKAIYKTEEKYFEFEEHGFFMTTNNV